MDAGLGFASLSLGFIVVHPVRHLAEINGYGVSEGPEVDGCVVEKIEIDEAVFRNNRGPLALRVF